MYDGTVSATATPTITTGALVSGDIGVYSQTYDTKSQGLNKVLTPAVVSILDASNTSMAGNYSITYQTNTSGVITAKQLMIADPTITKSKEYDKTVTVNTTAGTLSGVVTVGSSTDAVTVSSVGTYSTSTVGTGKTITVVYTLTGADKDNYIKPVDKVYTDGVITAKALTITGATTANKPYDRTNTASVTGGTLAGVISPDVVNLTQSGTFAQVNVGTGIAITSTSTIDNANYSLTQPTLTARDITAKALTITGATTANKPYDRTNTASVTGGTLAGVISPDVVNLTQSGTFAQVNVGTGIAITSTSTIDNANYTLTQPTGLAGDITPKTAIINILAYNKAYDGTTAATVLPSSPSFISPDIVSINYTSSEFDTKAIGNNKTVTVTGINLQGLDAPNYVVASTTAITTANITGKPFAVPNAFTPNGDGKNDTFKIIFNNTTGVTLRMQIFNRNGLLLFSTNNISEEWDGRSLNGAMQDMGIYFVKYRIDIAGGMTYEDTPRLYLLK